MTCQGHVITLLLVNRSKQADAAQQSRLCTACFQQILL